ncbi:hypothetical protein VPHK460_0219 [Vibrio phage K460]
MQKYCCDYCGDALCPEACQLAVSAKRDWIGSEEFTSMEIVEGIF